MRLFKTHCINIIRSRLEYILQDPQHSAIFLDDLQSDQISQIILPFLQRNGIFTCDQKITFQHVLHILDPFQTIEMYDHKLFKKTYMIHMQAAKPFLCIRIDFFQKARFSSSASFIKG